MLESEDVVNFNRAQELSDEKGFVACVETSSKTGEGVTELFETAAKEILRHQDFAEVLPLAPVFEKVISPDNTTLLFSNSILLYFLKIY